MSDEMPPDLMEVRAGLAPFAQVPEWIVFHPTLSAQAVRLYAALYRYTDTETRVAFPSRKRLARQLGCSTTSIDRWVKELVEIGALDVVRRFSPQGDPTSNLYTLVHNPPADAVVRSTRDMPEAKAKNPNKARPQASGGGSIRVPTSIGAARHTVVPTGGHTVVPTGGHTVVPTGGHNGAALKRANLNESHLNESRPQEGEANAAEAASRGGVDDTPRHADATSPPPVDKPSNALPPGPKLFPEQCSRHQDDVNEEPCGACGAARRRTEKAREAALLAASTAPPPPPIKLSHCRVHLQMYERFCSGCRSDAIAAS